jgi:hypothetical protein
LEHITAELKRSGIRCEPVLLITKPWRVDACLMMELAMLPECAASHGSTHAAKHRFLLCRLFTENQGESLALQRGEEVNCILNPIELMCRHQDNCGVATAISYVVDCSYLSYQPIQSWRTEFLLSGKYCTDVAAEPPDGQLDNRPF